MPNPVKLDILRELRESAGLNQKEAAKLCGLTSKQGRLSLAAWEQGETIPRTTRRTKFIGYLWDGLGLRTDPAAFERVWETLVHEWRWDPIEDREWGRLTRMKRPSNGLVSSSQDTVHHNPYTSLAPQVDNSVATIRRKIKVTLYSTSDQVDKPKVLFGRDSLLNEVKIHVSHGCPVLLYGSGGMGKTVVAQTYVSEFLDEGLGSALWMQIDNEELEEMQEAIIQCFANEQEKVLQNQQKGEYDGEAIMKLLRRSQARLIVLDNASNGHALYSFLQCVPDEMNVLITSRTAFPNCKQLLVEELCTTDAVAMLSYHATRDELATDMAAEELCADLGGHAYAVEIAGAILAMDDFLSPEQLSRQMQQKPHNLSMPAGFTQDGRQSVKALLDQSYESLTDEMQRVFRAFGAFSASGATAKLLAVYLSEELPNVETLLRDLTHRALVKRVSTEYYELHELTFSYTQSLFHNAIHDPTISESETILTITGAIQRFVEMYSNDFNALDADQSNILGVVQSNKDDAPDFLIDTLYALADSGYFDRRGHSAEHLALLDEAIEAVEANHPEQENMLHQLLSKRGNAYFAQGEYELTFNSYQRALTCAPNSKREVMLLAGLGKVSVTQQELALADQYFRRAFELAQKTSDHQVICFVLTQQCHSAAIKEDYQELRDLAIQGILLCKEYNDSVNAGYFQLNLGTAEFELGVRKSISDLEVAVKMAEEQDDSVLLAFALEGLGMAWHSLGDANLAEGILLRAHKLFDVLGYSSPYHKLTHFLETFGYTTCSASDLGHYRESFD